MERRKNKGYSQKWRACSTLVVVCGMMIMCLVVSPVLGAEKVELYGVVKRYPITEAATKAAREDLTWAKLDVDLMPSKAQYDKTRMLLHAKSPDLDIVHLNESVTAEWAPFLEPLNDYMKRYWDKYKFGDMNQGILDMLSVEETVYGLPNDMNGLLLFYRKDLLDQAGVAVPTTMDEFLKAAKKLTTNERKGIALQMRRPVGTQTSFSYFLWSVGGDYFDENWIPIFNNEKGIQALELLGEFYKCAPEGSLDFWADEQTIALQQDKAAMGINWVTRCAKMDDPKFSKVVGKMQFAPAPGAPPFSGCGRAVAGGWSISKFSRHKEKAFETIAYLASEELAMRFADLAISPRSAVFTNPEINEKYRWYRPAGEALGRGRPLPSFPEFWEIGDHMAIQIQRFLIGEMQAKAALDIAAEKSEALLKQKGYVK